MDNDSVAYSVGFLEQWINIAEDEGAPDAAVARGHLKILEDTWTEYRQSINTNNQLKHKIREFIQQLL